MAISVAMSRAKREADADLAPPPTHGAGDRAVHTNNGKRGRECAEQSREHRDEPSGSHFGREAVLE